MVKRSSGPARVTSVVTAQAVGGSCAPARRMKRPSGRRGRDGAGRVRETEDLMAYTICEPCIGTKDTACVDVCPVDCIHPRKDEEEFEAAEKLYIHPDECIDCGACVPACPVEAIFANDEVPDEWKNFIDIDAEYYADK